MSQSPITTLQQFAPDEVLRDQDEIARVLVETEAVNLAAEEKYRFGSGLPSPIYIDNRRLLSLVEARAKVRAALWRRVSRDLREERINLIVGVPTGGLPWAAWLADDLSLPLAYVRQAAKDRGLKKQIEGIVPAGARALVVDDLVTTGESSLVAIDALSAAGAQVVAVASIFSYGVRYAADLFGRRLGIRHVAITDLDAILRVGSERFGAEICQVVATWQKNTLIPFDPGQRQQ